MTETLREERGQALVEFTLVSLLIVIALFGAPGLLLSHWNRFRCARETFEAGHARLYGKRFVPSRRVRVTETFDRVEAVGRCGSSVERVAFRKLEPESP